MSATRTYAPPGRAARRRPIDRDLIATAMLAGYTWVVVIGFARVFSGWSFLSDLTAIVLVGHGLSFALRRARVNGWIAVPLMAFALLCLVSFQNYRGTLAGVLPTSETWQLFRLETDLVRDQFRTTVAPVVHGAGWAALAGAAVAIAVVLSDTFAFRAEARGEALVPGGVLFIFISAVGYDRLRVALTAAVIAAGFLAVVALRSLHDRSRRVELVEARHPLSLTAPAAVGGAAAVALIAAVVGPLVPGADSEALFDTRGRNGGVTEVISPLVDIRSRLIKQRDNEMFRMTASERSYWRMTTLPEFDGTTFRLPDRPIEQVDGTFAESRPDAVEIRQDVEILDLGGQFVPAAADPVAASGRDGLRWNADTHTLVVVGDELTRGDRITIVSSSPRPSPDALRVAGVGGVPDPVYLGLPDGFPAPVAELAAEVTAGTTNPYDAALALQSWFRNEFTYSLEVPRGHGTDAIVVFLRERIGYCEQFAATFAAMARTLDIPSRVAVGFTYGLQTPDGRYSVYGKNLHAWPELWFDGIGWVQFEPTPGRGAPGTEQFTGVAPDQDESPAQPVADDGDGDGDTAPATADTTPFQPGPNPLENDPEFPGSTDGEAAPRQVAVSDDGFSWRPLLFAAAVLVLLALPALVRRVRRHWRRRAPPVERVLTAWQRASAAVKRAGVPATSAMTPVEWASATSAALPVAARPMRSLAETVELVVYGRPGRVDLSAEQSYGTSLAAECAAWSHQVEAVVHDSLSTKDRFVDYFADWS